VTLSGSQSKDTSHTGLLSKDELILVSLRTDTKLRFTLHF